MSRSTLTAGLHLKRRGRASVCVLGPARVATGKGLSRRGRSSPTAAAAASSGSLVRNIAVTRSPTWNVVATRPGSRAALRFCYAACSRTSTSGSKAFILVAYAACTSSAVRKSGRDSGRRGCWPLSMKKGVRSPTSVEAAVLMAKTANLHEDPIPRVQLNVCYETGRQEHITFMVRAAPAWEPARPRARAWDRSQLLGRRGRAGRAGGQRFPAPGCQGRWRVTASA